MCLIRLAKSCHLAAGQVHAEQISAPGVRVPAEPNKEQDHQCPGPFFGGASFLY